MRHLLTRLLLGLLGTGLLLGPVAAWPAAAASPPRPTATTSLAPTATATAELVRLVMTAASPAKALVALPRADRARVRAAIRGLAPLRVSTRGGPLPLSAATGLRRAAAARERCWYRYWYYDWGTFGIVMAHTWMTLNWCGDGHRVTRWSRGATGGSSSVAGLSYRGVSGRGALHLGWEVRAYTQFHFSAGLGVTIDTTPCQQIRGGASGLYSQRDSCDLR